MATQLSEDFAGIESDSPQALAILLKGVGLAESVSRSVTGGTPIPMFNEAAASAASALFAAIGGRCKLAAPVADIETETDTNGELILRCLHAPPHKWGFDGRPR